MDGERARAIKDLEDIAKNTKMYINEKKFWVNFVNTMYEMGYYENNSTIQGLLW